MANSDEQSSIVIALDLISSVNYPNKQQNFSEFITFSSQNSGKGCPSPTLRKQKTQGQPNEDVFTLLQRLKP